MNARPLLDVLEEQTKEILREVGVMQIFQMPSLQQNIPLLYVLVRAFNREKQAFFLGNTHLKITVNEVALILGLPNRGLEFQFFRLPCRDVTHKDLIEELNNLTVEEWSPTLESRRVDALIRYLVNVFLFPLKGMKVPASLHKINGLSTFVKYNWPKAIHHFLLSQLDSLKQASLLKKVGVNLGYIEGCAPVLLVWFYEHTNVQEVVNDLARPRICRWSAKKSYRANFCFNLIMELRTKYEVKTNFLNILENEEYLLGEEDDDSDFEPVKRKDRTQGIEFDEQADLELRKELDEYVHSTEENRLIAKNEATLLRKGRKGVEKKKLKKEVRRQAEHLLDEGLGGLEERLQSFIKKEVRKEVETIKDFCESWFLRLEAKCYGRSEAKQDTQQPTPPPSPAPISPQKPKKDNDNFLISSLVRNVKKRAHRKPKTIDSPLIEKVKVKEEYNYPGRPYISVLERKVIDDMLEQFPESNNTVFNKGNVLMTREGMDDLLRGGWLHNTHLNAYALALMHKKKITKGELKNFLYVSSDYAFYRRQDAQNTRCLISHLNKASVRNSELIIMPCHLTNHWALLVCRLKECQWEFYDSMKSKRHSNGLPKLVKLLHEEATRALPVGINEWPIVEVPGLPQQANGDDCGVFVLKYMEFLLKREEFCWTECSAWGGETAKFRAEIAADLITSFVEMS